VGEFAVLLATTAAEIEEPLLGRAVGGALMVPLLSPTNITSVFSAVGDL
jgi:hypothetical protein